MPPTTDQAICIRQWDWSETSQTVSLFGRSAGMIRAVAKGSKREGARFSGGVEIMTRGEMVANIKSGDALAVLAAWDLQETFPAARSSLRAFYAGMFALDTLRHAVHDHDPHPMLFDALLRVLRRLGSGAGDSAAMAAYLWETLHETGHRPELGLDVRTGSPVAGVAVYGFSPHAGGVTADTGLSTGENGEPLWRVRAETVDFLRSLRPGTAPEGVASATASRAVRLLAFYFREAFHADPPTLGPYLGTLDPEPPALGE